MSGSETPRDNSYVRPNQTWACGKASEGCECPLGPSRRGVCQATFECSPFKKGDSWLCTRSVSMGGKCAEGPMPDGTCCRAIAPCVPTRSLRSLRVQVTVALFALAAGISLIFLALPRHSSLASPGPLTTAHSTTPGGCADCHTVEEGMRGLIAGATHPDSRHGQSAKCIECHKDLGPDPMKPHSISRVSLEKRTDRALSTDGETTSSSMLVALAKAALGTPMESEDVQCATCHNEHEGMLNDMTRLSNEQCQICHVKTFASFSNGHPDFVDFPFRKRTGIYFDHQSHYGRHFTGAAAGIKSCSHCHQETESGGAMNVLSFEDTCASCHDHQIKDDLTPGFVVAAIPSMDVDSLLAAGIDVGSWPRNQPIHVSATGRLQPLLRTLLAHDARFMEISDVIDAVDLSDLRDASQDQMLGVEKFAWLVKDLLHQSVTGAADEAYASQDLDPRLGEFLERIPTEFIDTVQQRLFPDLLREMKAKREGGVIEFTPPLAPESLVREVASQNRRQAAVNSGWYLSEADMTVRYRPYGHADALLKAISEFAVASDSGLASDAKSRKRTLAIFSPFAAGRCFKCHTVDRAEGVAKVHWSPKDSIVGGKPFTSFDHGPHVSNGSNQDCSACHRMTSPPHARPGIFRPEFVHSSGFLNTDPLNPHGDFVSMGISNCSNCHQEASAGDRCLDCHNYHIH